MADNSFNANVGSLFQGMEGFITGKTVVGDAVKFDDGTIILPLVDVSFGVAAGAFAEPGPSSFIQRSYSGEETRAFLAAALAKRSTTTYSPFPSEGRRTLMPTCPGQLSTKLTKSRMACSNWPSCPGRICRRTTTVTSSEGLMAFMPDECSGFFFRRAPPC